MSILQPKGGNVIFSYMFQESNYSKDQLEEKRKKNTTPMSTNNNTAINYDTFIRNNTMPCNFLDYDNVLSNNKIKTDDQFNHVKLKAFKNVLSNEDQALNTLLLKKEIKAVKLEEYSTQELLDYRNFLKNENEAVLTNEYNELDQEFTKLYHLKELLMNKLVDISVDTKESNEDNEIDQEAQLKNLESILVQKLINKLDDNNVDMISLLKEYGS